MIYKSWRGEGVVVEVFCLAVCFWGFFPFFFTEVGGCDLTPLASIDAAH